MRVQLLFAEALRSARASLSTTFAATMTVLIAMFLLGVAVAVGTWARSWIDNRKEQLVVEVFFCTQSTCGKDVTPKEIDDVRAKLERDPRVKDVRFVSKEEALEIMEKRAPELVEGLTSNPLPHAEEVTPNDPDQVDEIAASLEPLPAGVEKVSYGERSATTILWWGRLIWIFFAGIVTLLLVAATMLIANTIRLSIFARRREIEVMKLVGASNWFVRGPFMLEGLFCGLVGSVVAITFLLLIKEVAMPAIFSGTRDSNAEGLSSFWLAVVLLGAGLILGAASSGLTLRRFLRV